MKKKTAVSLGMLSLALAAGLLTACGSGQKTGAEEGSGEDNKLYVYNWGEYIDESVIDEFEEETESKSYTTFLKQMKKCIPS